MKIGPLSLKDVGKIRKWRNENLQALRTPFLLTQEMQEDFYYNVISNRSSNMRFWALIDETAQWNLLGMIGLVNIEWENRLGEISIILKPDERGKGLGKEAIKLLLDQGFYYLNLDNIYGECYQCNSCINFWEKTVVKYNAVTARLPNRKYYNGKYWDSYYFSINKNMYTGLTENKPKK